MVLKFPIQISLVSYQLLNSIKICISFQEYLKKQKDLQNEMLEYQKKASDLEEEKTDLQQKHDILNLQHLQKDKELVALSNPCTAKRITFPKNRKIVKSFVYIYNSQIPHRIQN